MSTKFQKYLSTNDQHDENNFECLGARPIPTPELVPSFFQSNNSGNNLHHQPHFVNKPKPFPLYKQLHENLCKFKKIKFQYM